MTTRKKHSRKEKSKKVPTTVEEAMNDRIPVFMICSSETKAENQKYGGIPVNASVVGV
ncbi:unnamed protein product [Brassica oleracea]